MNEKTFSFKDIAAELGFSSAEIVIQMVKDGGMLNPNGLQTEFAISGDLLSIEEVETIFCPN